jgi:hypothetical protein
MAGNPEEFIIIFDEGNANIRTETWVYEDIERYLLSREACIQGEKTSHPNS